MFLYFPFPNNQLFKAKASFMSFPIRNESGYVWLGIFCSVLFIIALILLAIGLKKFRLRILLIVSIAFILLPQPFIRLYQETLANDIHAISYDGKGKCTFTSINETLLNGECKVNLQNRSNREVTLNLQFLDSYFTKDGTRMESLMNIAGPYQVIIEANTTKSIYLNELLDVSNVPSHIESGTMQKINLKLSDNERERIL